MRRRLRRKLESDQRGQKETAAGADDRKDRLQSFRVDDGEHHRPSPRLASTFFNLVELVLVIDGYRVEVEVEVARVRYFLK